MFLTSPFIDQAWVLKNSHSRSPQKFHRARMPYKRRSRFWWTFSTPRLEQFFQNREFFNSHRRSHQLAPFVRQKPRSMQIAIYRQLSGSEVPPRLIDDISDPGFEPFIHFPIWIGC